MCDILCFNREPIHLTMCRYSTKVSIIDVSGKAHKACTISIDSHSVTDSYISLTVFCNQPISLYTCIHYH